MAAAQSSRGGSSSSRSIKKAAATKPFTAESKRIAKYAKGQAKLAKKIGKRGR